MNSVKVLFFATLRDRAGVKETQVEIPEDARVADLKARLCADFPALVDAMGSTLVSINREYAFDEDIIPSAAEVALFPPVSGGVDGGLPTIVAVIEDKVDLNEMLRGITLPTTGAICCFTGMVRGVTERDDPHETAYLEYEAYQQMAEVKMRQVADEVRARWPTVEGIVIVQRLGHLAPGTPTVVIACSAAHRDTGVFEAAHYGIDRLKEIVPVWKKEVGPGGESWVEGKYIPNPND